MELRDLRCVGSRCGLLLSIRDEAPNQGRPIPAPIDSRPVRVLVDGGDGGPPWQALLSVQPLDLLRNTSTSGEPVRVTASTIFASSASLDTGARWRLAHPEPARWFVFGSASLSGEIDLRGGPASEAGPGGGQGGAPGAEAPGPGGGAGGAGGGGGGYGAPGGAGRAADGGTGGEGGAAWGEPAIPCLSDPAARRCGGGGGGGGREGRGGGGGGSLLLVVLGDLDLSGARLRADGTAGEGGGGGGAGGAVHLAAWRITGFDAPSVAGGEGSRATDGASGGQGGEGRLRLDTPEGGRPMASFSAWLGPAVDPREVPPFLESEEVLLRGRATPGSGRVQVGLRGSEAPLAEALVGADGAFEVRVRVPLGLARLWVRTEGGARSWVGNALELETVEPGRPPLPVGALIDLVRLR